LNGPVHILVKARVFPTESVERVSSCIKNIFPDAKLEACEGRIHGTSGSYAHFVELLTKQQIRDTARDQILRFRKGDTTRLFLNKQAAFAGKVNLCGPADESLGSLEVSMTLADWDAFLKLVTPPIILSKLLKAEPEEDEEEPTS
jgi:uncharacterized protein